MTETIVGTYGDDLLNYFFTPGTYLVNALAGNDRIYTAEGNDTINAGEGDDIASGGAGNDIIYGVSGNDWLMGSYGDDVIYGGDGNDSLHGEQGNDTLYGGDGVDEVAYGLEWGSGVFVNLMAGTASDTGGGIDILFNIENVRGTTLSDTIHGSDGANYLRGQQGHDYGAGHDGDDVLDGSVGHDTLLGGDGNDTLIGGVGHDVLTGDAGSDVFVFASIDTGYDTITDFAAGINGSGVIQTDAFASFQEALDASHDDGQGSCVIEFSETASVTLWGVEVADLDANDFVFV